MAETLTLNQKLTPMMEQYRAIKKTLPPETILFFRLGDFYEMFFEDAVRASDFLDITLTGRDGGEAGRVPMCGIPHHAVQGYVRTLLDHNLKVAICEQIGDPKAAKGLLERKITRIITPATYLDEETKGPAPEYMAALARDGAVYGLSYLELSTGEFCVREVQEDRLTSELALLSPREVILPKTLASHPTLSVFLREALHAAVTAYDDWIFEPAEGQRLLTETFALGSGRGIAFHDRPLCVGAGGAILYYLKDHLHRALEHLQPPRLLEAGDHMVVDRQTQRSLELVTSLGGARTGTLLACLDHTRTSMGARTLSQWVLHPLLAREAILRRQDGVQELVVELARAQSLRALLEGVKDLERAVSRLNYGVANGRDLLNLALLLTRAPAMQEELRGTHSALLTEIAGSLHPFPDLRGLIERAIVEVPPLTTKEGHLIKPGHSKERDELEALAKRGRTWITQFQQREIERTGIKSLRVKYSQVFGYAIEVTQPNLHLVPPDYRRKQTLASAERFVVPELLEWDRKIHGAEERIKALEYRLFCDIRERVLAHLAPLQDMAKALGVLDALLSLALTAAQRSWVRPEVTETEELVIQGGRHPVVEAAIPYGQFVENETRLDTGSHQLLILTGPNMAGKSTYVRQVALITLLAQIGSFVPAASARIGLVDRIFTRIGAADNLAAGESTFMVEMIETAHILRHATRRSLLILDEVGRGTSTFDGVSIAWAICEHLTSGPVGPRTLFATHYHELTQLEAHSPRIKNYTITVRETGEGIVFLRKVVPGATDKSYGIHVARLAGIPPTVTTRAEEILGILEQENTQATRIIEREAAASAGAPSQPATPSAPSPRLLEELQALDPDAMTPREALTLLARWREELRRRAGPA